MLKHHSLNAEMTAWPGTEKKESKNQLDTPAVSAKVFPGIAKPLKRFFYYYRFCIQTTQASAAVRPLGGGC